MNLFYQPEIDLTGQQIVFNKEESRHITRVLRYQVGDVVFITDGKGTIVSGRIERITPKESIASIETIEKRPPLPYRLHLAVAPTKNNDRFEWFLEKATEIGIHAITPIFCERSERKVIKPERFERIIESAMKQSLKAYKPILHAAVSFSKLLEQQHSDTINCIAHCDEGSKTLLQQLVQPKGNVLIAIGPEGDFSRKEIDLALLQGFHSISLGNSRLRTETAAVVACHTVALINQ